MLKQLLLFLIGGVMLVQSAAGDTLCIGTPAEYVIITSSERVSAFNTYVAAKNTKGIATRVFTVADITANYSGTDTQEQIRNFIIDAYNTWSISYVLLGGDETVVPIRYSGSLIRDSYYYTLTGNGLSGSVTVLGGRLPTKTIAQTQSIATLWSSYDGTAAWTRENTYVGWADNQLDDMNKFNGTAIGTGDVTLEIIEAINEGRGVVHYFGHGAWGGWSTSIFGHPHARMLSNGDKMPVVIASACLTGTFDVDNSLAEAFFEAINGGVLAYVGANKEIYFNDAYTLNNGYFAAFKASYYDNGRINPCASYHFGNFNQGIFNYLGDPSVEIDLRMPGDMTPPVISNGYVSHATITAYQSVSVAATVTDNDEVSSNIWAVLSYPDLSTATINLIRGATSTTYSGQFSDTGQLGDYSLVIHGQDISGNEQTAGTLSFTVSADNTPPVINSMQVEPVTAFPGQQVSFNISASDDSGARMSGYLGVTIPTQPLPSYYETTFFSYGGAYCSFTITAQPGDYKAQVQFVDPTGNRSIMTPIVSSFPDIAFTVIDDSIPPTINAAWFVNMMGMCPTQPNEYAITNLEKGNHFVIWIDVTDEETMEGMEICWADITNPAGISTTTEQMCWMGTGAYPPGTGYCTMAVTTSQVGFYSVTVNAQDAIGNKSSAYVGLLNIYQPPTEISANPGNNQVHLAWAAADSGYDITGYNIHCSNFAGDSNTILANTLPVSTTTYTHTELVNGVTYYYRVIALDAAGNTCGWTSEVAVKPTAEFVLPTAPINVISTAGDSKVVLSWSDGVAGTLPISGYNVYRANFSGGYTTTPLNSTPLTVLTYTDSTVVNATEYFYILKTTDAASNTSAATAELSEIPYAPASVIADMSATSGNAEIFLNWTAPVAGTYAIQQIEIYRGTTSGGQYPTALTITAVADAYTDTAVANGTEYFYILRVLDVEGHYNSESNEASAIPNIPQASQPANPAAEGQVNQILLTWDSNPAYEELTAYAIYRSTSSGFTPGPSSYLGQTLYNEFSSPGYLDTATVNNIRYYYCITAENARGTSNPSTEISATSIDSGDNTPTATSTPTMTSTPTVTPIEQSGADRIMSCPNPARGTVRFLWPEQNVQKASIDIYNVSGERIAKLVQNQPSPLGVIWESDQVATGIYYYRILLELEGGMKKSEIQKLVILK